MRASVHGPLQRDLRCNRKTHQGTAESASKLETKDEFERFSFLEGEQDEQKSDGARSVNLKRPSFERSGGGRPGKLATQRHSNATGEDAAEPNICS